VFVHQFIASGTLEERVDEILERKSRVAGTLVQSGEAFLAQLGGEELIGLVGLEDGT
jgi:SNF2 family DNA or RNA helicase